METTTEAMMLATSLHKGNSGISTGATPRPKGRTHWFDPTTERTLCGLPKGKMVIHRANEGSVRLLTCSKCLKKGPAR